LVNRLDDAGCPTDDSKPLTPRQSPAVAVIGDELLVFGGEARGELLGEPCSVDLGDGQVRSGLM
jgi:hypothetical protein